MSSNAVFVAVLIATTLLASAAAEPTRGARKLLQPNDLNIKYGWTSAEVVKAVMPPTEKYAVTGSGAQNTNIKADYGWTSAKLVNPTQQKIVVNDGTPGSGISGSANLARSWSTANLLSTTTYKLDRTGSSTTTKPMVKP